MGSQEICGLINSSTFVILSQNLRRGLKKAGELDIPKVYGAEGLKTFFRQVRFKSEG